ncbi:MAG: peptidyl-prolyl cis-trans isomerase [Acidobacteriota bacterium]|nr:peptidyl-prolyl cis-trans isomerase [Acidobacteriota bacterium]MDH3523027.1 peptidyl-prolyl cis-trans isomerase [Acidobacteriota bacterium]
MIFDSLAFSRPAAPLVAACALFGAVAAGSQMELPPTTVAVVNGEAITIEDLEKSLETLHGEAETAQRSPARLERLLFKAVNDVLIGQEARVLGLHEEPPIPETLERNRRRLALSILEREEIEGPAEPGDDEVTAIFEERYRRASFHVLTAGDFEGAERILDALRAGVDIGTVAREQSIDPYREQGGLVEGVARKDLQLVIADLVFTLAPNEVAGPVQTDLGWSVVVAQSFQGPDPELFEEARPLLERLARQRRESTLRQELLAGLRSRHAVWIDRDLVDSISPVRRRDGRLTAESPGPETVVARIGDEITLSGDEYAVALERRWRTIPDEEAARAAGPIILENLINERLLLAEAYRRGYHELPAVRRALHRLETDLVVPKYLSSVLAAGVEVSEEEMRAYYEETKAGLKRPPRVQLGQITVPSLEEAESVAAALRGGSDLGWLAERHSTDGLRDKGGVKGWSVVRPGGAGLDAALLAAETGATLDPVPGDGDSWVVYKVLAREEQGVYSYEEVSGNMREAVFRREFTAVLDRFIQSARSRSEIEVREDVLAALELSGTQEVEDGSGHGGHGVHGEG